ncbi:SDR family oxidoreductase [Aestuariivirga litoralis]|uniref:SDR family oxidoreductase n=1 Tax=Aestuariivirga litoralis TaxID=2650924 RepID=UPI0018C618C7|nr:NAD(P)-dependent oxidoreductase [Aestuariivirga litoralis]
MSLKGTTLFITGASRGIGKAIALRAARDGANIVVAAKTAEEHAKLPGTIYSAADEIKSAGGNALPVIVDVRDEESIKAATEKAAETFGGIDIVINNASAINLTGTAQTPMRRYDLMMQVNIRGTFAVTQACLPYLKKAANPHILTLSPPPSLDPKWFGPHVAYTISKMGMSLCVLGWAEEFRDIGIAANALWPRTIIETAALAMLGGIIKPEHCRKPDIVADAAHAILTKLARECTGNFFIDDEVLAKEGITDLSGYSGVPGSTPMRDLFLDR